ncbi:MAG TPA: sigma-70 family RNA polymerase sigma factor [Chitinophagaceae bacterium]|nr:sigma-70 family RNA polymerase sigma factor [Chitinophagaceae bacterium]
MTNSPQHIVNHLFRHESGRMVAVLARIFGLHNLQLAEDVVQEAFLKAMQTWKFDHIPDNPSAWLMQVARNKAIDLIRKQQHANLYSREIAGTTTDEETSIIQFFHEEEIADSQLRMIFACAHPFLKEEDQIALTLKTVSGFSAAEIAKSLLTSEAVIQKRLYRAKEFIRQHNVQFHIPAGKELEERINTVHAILYLIFNEGYNSMKADELIRKDLCGEAMRLCKLLTEHKRGNIPATFALLSLMCFHAARFESRLTENNELVLLQEQDRSKWNKDLITIGYNYLNHSTAGNQLSVYHIESAIAAEHCLAPTFSQTNWERLLRLYDLLMEVKPSAIVQLSRAVVIAEMGNIQMAIESIHAIAKLDQLMNTHYIYSAVLGDLYKRLSNTVKAKQYLEQAHDLTHSDAEKKLIHEKLEAVLRSSQN